jgi:predicted DNA-binding transcriptional regulator AlpA
MSSTEGFVLTRQIMQEQSVTDRCIRKWIANGRFPKPDGNRNGRNVWLPSTYAKYCEDVLAGRYAIKSSFISE